MGQLPWRLCRKPGCSSLVKKGYCPAHTIIAEQSERERFKALDARKTPEMRKFYSSAAWTKISRLHRIREPLCRRCRERGKVRPAALTHHSMALQALWNAGLNPFDEQYLESLCHQCHQEDLKAKNNG
jgi:5-methylcytosine-specific restriction enzyme A